MGKLKYCAGFVFCILIPVTLLGSGVFKNEWATSQNATCTPVRLYRNPSGCEDDFYAEKVLQLLSFSSMLMFIISFGVTDYCRRRDTDESSSVEGFMCICNLLCCMNGLIFPFAGILSLAGCIKFSAKFSTSDLGLSFFLCLAAGCIHILGMLYIVVNVCRQVCSEEDEDTTVSVPPSSDVVPSVSYTVPYSEQTHAVRVTEEAAAIQTERGIIFSMRKKIEFVQHVF